METGTAAREVRRYPGSQRRRGGKEGRREQWLRQEHVRWVRQPGMCGLGTAASVDVRSGPGCRGQDARRAEREAVTAVERMGQRLGWVWAGAEVLSLLLKDSIY